MTVLQTMNVSPDVPWSYLWAICKNVLWMYKRHILKLTSDAVTWLKRATRNNILHCSSEFECFPCSFWLQSEYFSILKSNRSLFFAQPLLPQYIFLQFHIFFLNTDALNIAFKINLYLYNMLTDSFLLTICTDHVGTQVFPELDCSSNARLLYKMLYFLQFRFQWHQAQELDNNIQVFTIGVPIHCSGVGLDGLQQPLN